MNILKLKLFIECWKLARRSGKGLKTAIAIYREQFLMAGK